MDLRKYIDNTFTEKKSIQELFEKSQEQIDKQEQLSKEQQKKFKEQTDTLQRQITNELKKNLAEFRGSYLENAGGNGNSDSANQSALMHSDLKDLINRKVDKTDFREYLHSTIHKKEHEMALRQIETIHSQLKNLVYLLSQKFSLSI